jgi:hypothetical protein
MTEDATQSASFNTIAERVTNDLQPYEKAIAVMKDMQDNWGKDSKGRYFTFEAALDHCGISARTILVGTLHNYHPAGSRNQNVPTLFVGLPTDSYTPKGAEFTVAQRWTDPSAPMSERIREAYVGGGLNRFGTAETSDDAVISFAEDFMLDHPGFQRTLQSAAQEFISKIPAKGPKRTL